jgi:hypothetical protein
MEQIYNWRKNKNDISLHNIEIGSYNDQIGLIKDTIGEHNTEIGKHNTEIGSIRDTIGEHNTEIGSIRDTIGEHKEKISMCENDNRETPYYWVNQWVNNNLPSYSNNFDDSVSQGQYESKLWLSQELKKIQYSGDLHIDIIGSWFGYPLIEMLSKNFNISQIDLYDLDENCHKIFAQYKNHFDEKFKIAQFGDFFERTELRRRQLIINTSSEHMADIALMKDCYKDYPIKPTIAIQSNNYFELDDHINCVKDVNELVEKNQIKDVLYKGKRSLPLYDRFMVIGKW